MAEHVKGEPYRFRHGWVPVGGAFNVDFQRPARSADELKRKAEASRDVENGHDTERAQAFHEAVTGGSTRYVSIVKGLKAVSEARPSGTHVEFRPDGAVILHPEGKAERRLTDDAVIQAVDRHLKPLSDAGATGDDLANDFRRKVSMDDKSREHVARYILDKESTVNKALRTGDGVDTDHVAALDKVIQSYRTPRETVAYRGMYDNGHLPSSSLVGKTISDPAFMSTTSDRSRTFAGNVRMRIHVPKGSQALPVSGAVDFDKEKELLLPRNTHLTVTHDVTEGGTRWLTVTAQTE